MAGKPPIRRQDPLKSAGVDSIEPELEAQLGARERRRAQMRKAQRPKATYDLPTKLIERVKEVAEKEDVAQSDIVAWALGEFLERHAAGEVDLVAHKEYTRSLRVMYKLQLPAKWQ
jgi:hypothetical protein